MNISTLTIDTKPFLVIKGTEYQQIQISEIICIEVQAEKYLNITTTRGKFRILTSLTSIYKYLPNFIKVSRGLVINKFYLNKLVKHPQHGDTYILVLSAGEEYIIEISSFMAKNMLEQL